MPFALENLNSWGSLCAFFYKIKSKRKSQQPTCDEPGLNLYINQLCYCSPSNATDCVAAGRIKFSYLGNSRCNAVTKVNLLRYYDGE